MSLLRRKQAGPAATDPAVASHFDALIAAAARGEGPEAQAPFWKAVFALPAWHFIGDRDRPKAPVIRMRGGEPMVLAFTDEAHAQRFAVEANLLDDQGRARHLAMPLGTAKDYLRQLLDRGVRHILFNLSDDGPGGLGAELRPFLQHAHAAIQRRVAEAFDGLVREARAAGRGEAYGRVWASALKLPHWYFAGEKDSRERLLRQTINGEPAVLAFTDEVNAARFTLTRGSQSGDGSVPLIIHGVGAAMDVLIALHDSERVARVVFNIEGESFVGLLKDLPTLKQAWLQRTARTPEHHAAASDPEHADFDGFAAACRDHDTPENMDRLWRAVYALPRWHFVGRGKLEDNTVRPFVGVADGKPFVFAFTDPRRAHVFAAKNDLTQGPGAHATLSMRMPAAARYVGKLKDHGVFGILFNDGPNGFFAPLANVDPMLQHFYA